MSLVTDRGGHLKIFVFCEFLHIFLSVEFEGPVYSFLFLSLPHLISKATYEEKNVEKLGSESKLNRKTIIFTARIDGIIKMKSIGDVGVDDIKSDVAYVKEKEKHKKVCKSGACSFTLLISNVIADVLFSISVKLFFTSPNCKVMSSTV
jgi:hypothetical protein